MKKAQEKKQEYLKQGHGEYEEIPEEKEFFNVGKNSENVVCHFYKDDTFRCKIVDKHMKVGFGITTMFLSIHIQNKDVKNLSNAVKLKSHGVHIEKLHICLASNWAAKVTKSV